MNTLSEQISSSLSEVDSCQLLSDPQLFFESEGLGHELLSASRKLEQKKILFKNSEGVFFFIYTINGKYLVVKSRVNLAAVITEIIENHETPTIELSENEVELDPRLLDAKRVYRMILPGEQEVAKAFDQFFVIDMPQDVVGGDFYWFKDTKEYLYIALIDCTGHSVQGAMSAILCFNLLNKAWEKNLGHPIKQTVIDFYQMLQETNSKKYSSVGEEVGAELGLLQINKTTKKSKWCSTGIAMIAVCNKVELHKTRKSVMFNPTRVKEKSLSLADKKVLLFSDGIIDQFDQTDKKKLGYKGITSFVKEEKDFSFNYYQSRIQDWMKDNLQYDDISMIGVAV